jgi:glutathione S-transferase
MILPRPDLMPLTGGYRRTPVLQIGADVYCDTACIARELERRFPSPTLFPGGDEGVSWMISQWTDRPFFQASVGVIFGSAPEALPEGFLRDREQLSGRPFDVAAMRAAVPRALEQWRAFAALVERQLGRAGSSGEPWLLGREPGWADFSAAMSFWFVRSAYRGDQDLLAPLPRVREWLQRVRAIGHGQRVEMASGEALAVGAAATPAPDSSALHDDPLLAPGTAVTVTPDDYGRVPVAGEVVYATAERIGIRRVDAAAGEVVVHFPRGGFVVARAG